MSTISGARERTVLEPSIRSLSIGASLGSGWTLSLPAHGWRSSIKKLTVIGFASSVLWLIVVTAMLLGKSASLHEVKLNEWGDFLGEVSAPLALIWVVIGYFRQGEELRLNTEALKAQ